MLKQMDVVKELASDDKAYRSLTLSWFKNSPLLEIIQQAQKMGFKLILTTDHGTINVKNPSKVVEYQPQFALQNRAQPMSIKMCMLSKNQKNRFASDQ
jgi:hypothetical protein